MSVHWNIYEDPGETAAACCRKILDLLKEQLANRDRAALAISGGSTPKLLFAEMAKSGFDWTRVHLFFVDERCVPPLDDQSNYKLAKENFLGPAAFPQHNVHRIQGELDPESAARLYIDEIRNFFAVAPGEVPRFDIIHQGIGPDAHTASLFPGQPLIDDREKLVAAVYASQFQQWRVTLLPAVLLAARNSILLVAGADKAEALRSVLQEPYDPGKYPAQIMTRSEGNVVWFADKAAAGLLE